MQTLKSDFSEMNLPDSKRMLEEELIRLFQNKETQFSNFQDKKMDWEEVQKFIIIEDGRLKLNFLNLEKQIKYFGESRTPKLPSIIVRQIWYYNRRNKELNTKVIAISPILSTPLISTCWEGPFENRGQFCWIKMPQPKNFKFDINRKNLIWSRLTNHHFNFKNVKTLKGNTDEMLFKIFYQNPLSENCLVYSTEEIKQDSPPLELSEIQEIVESRVDTAIHFDPVTYKEFFVIKKSPKLQIGDIQQFQIVQQWYWDAKLQQLAVQLKAMTPIIGLNNQSGEAKWHKALYRMKFD